MGPLDPDGGRGVVRLSAGRRGDPWFVHDESARVELEATLDELWPAHSIDVVVGPRAGDGLELDGEALRLVVDGDEHTRDVGADVRAAVVLSRSWLRELEATEGWVPTPDNLIVEPEPPPEPPPDPLVGQEVLEDIDVGVIYLGIGGQVLASQSLWLDGIRAVAGVRLPHLSGELSMAIATGSATEYTTVDQIFTELAPDEVHVSFVDLFSAGAMGRLYLGAEPARRWTGGPTLIGGLEARGFLSRELTYDSQTDQATIEVPPNSQRLAVGPAIGLGLELWMGPHAALRLAEVDRIRIRDEGKGPVVRHDLTLMYEFLLRP